jgi:hypothetical protein
MDDDLEIAKLRFYRLANGLMAIVYLAFFAWVLAQVYNML